MKESIWFHTPYKRSHKVLQNGKRYIKPYKDGMEPMLGMNFRRFYSGPVLPESHVNLKRRSLVHVRFVEKWDTPIKDIRMNAQIVKEVTQLKNAQLGRSLVSCVKGLPTTLLSVTFTPWYKGPSSRRKKQ